MPSSLIVFATLLATWFLMRAVVSAVYRQGHQVEFRIARRTGTGEVMGLSGFSGLRLRVRSLSSGREHTVALTHVRRR